MKFNSRRSAVYGTRGMVASSQPLASEAGLRILQHGGNAADAAVAVAAALNVTEPTSTGIGGDCFLLYFDAKRNKIYGVNGSGRVPQDLTLDKLVDLGFEQELPPYDVNTITVPGAAAGWIDTISNHGTMSMEEILTPAIELAENGFPVAPLTARSWSRGINQLKNGPNANELLLNGEAPKEGQIIKLPNLAKTFREVAEFGKAGFYQGRVAQSLIELIQSMGGFMTLEDLKNHESTFDQPISVNYKGVEIYEMPPNGQGITALIALNILEEYELEKMNPLSAKYLHLLIESLRIAFADSLYYVADPSVVIVPTENLLSKRYALDRRKLIDEERATIDVKKGSPPSLSETVYFSVIDGDGNGCSFINSNYSGFGTGLIPKGCGFTLQNRGHNFSLDPIHPNVIAPGKRPYHTIIPAMATKNDSLYASFGVMGGFMQPQGHVQVILNMIEHKMNPQEALDHPRFCIKDVKSNGSIALEESISTEIVNDLRQMGHDVNPTGGYARSIFGRGQIIKINPQTGVLCGGTDPRADGIVLAW